MEGRHKGDVEYQKHMEEVKEIRNEVKVKKFELEAMSEVKHPTMDQFLSFDGDESGISPVLPRIVLTPSQKSDLRMLVAIWFAVDNMSQSSGAKIGFRMFMRNLGLDDFYPCPQTIRNYQSKAASEVLSWYTSRAEKFNERFKIPILSMQADVWTSPDGLQYMGVRLTGMDPDTLEPFTFTLPLVPAKPGSLDADAESELMSESLSAIDLDFSNIHSITTDTASVAKKSVTVSHRIGIECLSHKTNLVVKDNTTAKKPTVKVGGNRGPTTSSSSSTTSNLKLIEANELVKDEGMHSSVIPPPNRVIKHLEGMNMRSAHFCRSATDARDLNDWQHERGVPECGFLSYPPTRWTGMFLSLDRDINILENGGVEFFFAKIERKEISDALRLEHDVINYGRDIRSILYPLYKLTLTLQANTISLAEGVVASILAFAELNDDKLRPADASGYINDPRFKIKVVQTDLDDDLQAFRLGLKNSFKTRILDSISDEDIISIFFDPKSCKLLRSFKRNDLFPAEVCDIANSILNRFDLVANTIRNRMANVTLDEEESKEQITTAESSTEKSGIKLQVKDLDMDMQARLLLACEGSSESESTSLSKKLQHDFAEMELLAFQTARDAANESDIEFWKKHHSKFPKLLPVYIQSRGARPSTARLESDFSVAHGHMPKQRESMATASLNDQLILSSLRLPIAALNAATHKIS